MAPTSLPHPAGKAPLLAGEWLNVVELLLLGCIWGASFMLQRVAAPAFGAVPLVELRLAFGGLVLLPFLVAARGVLRPYAGKLVMIGLINSALPFVLFAWAAERAPAAIGAITNSMAALFVVLVAWLAFGERIGARRAIGLLAGFAGVIVLVGAESAGASIGLAAGAGVLAALCYGISGNLVKHWLTGLPPVAVAATTLCSSSVILAPLAIASWPAAAPGAPAWISAILLGVVCTGAAYALYFRLIARTGPARAASVTYLVPLFAVVWAWVLLGEPLTVSMAVAAGLILGGVALNQFGQRRVPIPTEPATTATAVAGVAPAGS
jgi:drug/metabolite transporter (DMT)-like permease